MQPHQIPRWKTTALMAGWALALAACGGGSSSGLDEPFLKPLAYTTQATAVSGVAAPARETPSAARTPTADEFFNWAQQTFPSVLVGSPQSGTLDVYQYRYYPTSNVYLAIANGTTVIGLVPNGAGGYQAVPLGSLSGFACSVFPADCAGGSSSYNECVDASAMALPTGFTTRIVFTYSGLITGEQTVETRVEGPSTFEGRSAIKTRAVTTGTNTVQGFSSSINTANDIYQVVGSNGLTSLLGGITEATTSVGAPIPIPGFPSINTVTTIKSVYNPPVEQKEYTLRLGESSTQTMTGTATTTITTAGVPAGSQTIPISGISTTYTFEARESVSVQGRSFEACRYTISGGQDQAASSVWFIVGKGIPVKTQTTTPQGSQTIEMKSGTYNGSPL